MKKVEYLSLFTLLILTMLNSCSKDEDDCPCRTAIVEGVSYQVKLCDEEVFDALEERGSPKEARLMEERSNCN